MISSDISNGNSSLLIAGVNDVRIIKHAFPWMCATSNKSSYSALALTNFPGSNDKEKKQNPERAVENWNVGGYKIDYCLQAHRSTENLCKVEYSLVIMIGTFALFTRGQSVCSTGR